MNIHLSMRTMRTSILWVVAISALTSFTASAQGKKTNSPPAPKPAPAHIATPAHTAPPTPRTAPPKTTTPRTMPPTGGTTAPTHPNPSPYTTSNPSGTNRAGALPSKQPDGVSTSGNGIAHSNSRSRNPTARTISLRSGGTANLRPNGKIRSIDRDGVHVQYSIHGDRKIVSDHNGARIVTTGSHRGYVQRPYVVRNGHSYVQRTYVVNHVAYTAAYRSYYYGGGATTPTGQRFTINRCFTVGHTIPGRHPYIGVGGGHRPRIPGTRIMGTTSLRLPFIPPPRSG